MAATLSIQEGRMEEGIDQMKALLKDSAYQCQAAFFLFALDVPRDEYLELLQSPSCGKKTPAFARMVDRLMSSEQELGQCLTRAKTLGVELQRLRENLSAREKESKAAARETAILEKEIARLRFELEKMEEIRRETERWRVK